MSSKTSSLTAPALAPAPSGSAWALGLLGVAIFALSIPMTRLASGSVAAPQLPAEFIALGRAALAGLCSLVYLRWTRAPLPRGRQWQSLAFIAAGVVFGWPLLMSMAVQQVDAVHASVISGVLPLATAVCAALLLRQRARPAFWGCALAGLALVIAFAAWRGAGAPQWADLLLLGGVCAAALGYVGGAGLSRRMKPEQVICWTLVLSLPLTLPLTLLSWPSQPVSGAAWGGFLYVSLFSMWLGFFAWYRALALGGALHISQVQILQPFLSMLMAVPLLGERLDAGTLGFALAVIAVVWAGKSLSAPPTDAPRSER
ncbi:DMT family transporter [Pelomonas sp. CA6]|uniref:DMT family transporter n=1 Tax=Pelomonas sp. CA6 TaxID=2907999 RepID=UPI001F4BD09D|nr:DMT family transporter [Pelomonas sp. CA6]MCH7345619.1 DMT family transporter [Pelomonas sp. CA6]